MRGRTWLVAALVVVATGWGASAAPPMLQTLLAWTAPDPPARMTPIPVQGCCKTCRKGKACGDTCISRDKQCHVGPGCACPR